MNESIALNELRELSQPCSTAVGKWHFSPILEDGKPRPRKLRAAFHE